MFSEKDLQSLLEYSTEGQVISVYLNTDPTTVSNEAAKLRLRNLLKTVNLPEDIQTVEEFVNLEYDWAAKGLVLFSDQAADFFQTYQFNVPLIEGVFVGKSPRIRPLSRLMDTFTGWGVVLVDKQGARLFKFNLGLLDEIDPVSGEEVKQTKRGGGNAMPGRMGGADASSKVENIIDRNIKEMIEYAAAFFNRYHIRRILIGGTDDNIARFREGLPKSWQSLVVGNFPMDMSATHGNIMAQAFRVVNDAQHRINRLLVEQAVTLAAKGSHGVTGLIDTLNAIHEGRVKTLLVLEDYEQAGYHCEGCGYLTTQDLETCSFCGGNFMTIETAVERAVQEALIKNAEVKVITEQPELEKAGQIAAILRY